MSENSMSAYTSDISYIPGTHLPSIYRASHVQEKMRSKCRWGRVDDLRKHEMGREFISGNERLSNTLHHRQRQAKIFRTHLPD